MPRKIVASLLLVTYLFAVQPRQAQAFAPALMAAGALGGLLVVAGTMTYYKPSGLPSSWGSEGVITRAGNVARVVAGTQLWLNQYGKEVMMGDIAAIKASYKDLQNYLANDTAAQTNYNALYNYLFTGVRIDALAKGNNIGDIVTIPGRNGDFKITNKYYDSFDLKTGSQTPGFYDEGFRVYFIEDGGPVGATGTHYIWTLFQVQSATAPPPAPKELRQLNPYDRVDPISPEVTSDLDRLIVAGGVVSSPYGCSVVDAAKPADIDGGKTLVPPIIPTPAIDTAAPTVGGFGEATATATATAAQAAAAAASSAQAAVDAYKAANPNATIENDPALAELVKQAADAAKQADTTQKTADDAKAKSEELYPNANTDALKKLNFDSLKKLMGALSNVWPISLMGANSSQVTSDFLKVPLPPVFELPLPMGNRLTVDLSPFDVVAKICRFVISVIITGGVVFYIIRFWRGVA